MAKNEDETLMRLEIELLINFQKDKEPQNIPNVEEFRAGQYETILNNDFCSVFVKPFVTDDDLENTLENAIDAQIMSGFEWVSVGVASLLLFVRSNWTGPELSSEIGWLSSKRNEAHWKLSFGDEFNTNMMNPELLHLSKIIFSNDKIQIVSKTAIWWLFRVHLLHQIVLDEASAALFEATEILVQTIHESDLLQDDYLRTLFYLETTQFYFHHRRIQSSQKQLEMAQDIAGLNLELVGALGKRTKYQQDEKAQLLLRIEMDKEIFFSRSCNNVPKALELNDDLRLECVKYSEETHQVILGALEEAIVLGKYFQVQMSQPKDKLTDEEIIPYLDNVIENTMNWPLKMSALCQRCILESNHKRTIERSMCQTEYLIEQLNSTEPPVLNRMDLFFASGLKPIWELKHILADLMLNLGMVKGALDIYLQLQLWEDVIVCYTILDLRHKAAEIIQQEIAKNPTVMLWCLLGDAKQDTECYQIAWEMSGKNSSRVQRHWGFYYFSKCNYEEAIPHLKLSAELNNIQENVWIRLGFAALQIENWNVAATAYRHYCALEQTNFEAWNNLAKAYIKLGDKPRAWRSFQDAVKCNYDRWEVWDNLMVVSIDLGQFAEITWREMNMPTSDRDTLGGVMVEDG